MVKSQTQSASQRPAVFFFFFLFCARKVANKRAMRFVAYRKKKVQIEIEFNSELCKGNKCRAEEKSTHTVP